MNIAKYQYYKKFANKWFDIFWNIETFNNDKVFNLAGKMCDFFTEKENYSVMCG